MTTTDTGRQAETAAAVYLERRGFRIVERNFRTPQCEVDIIAEKQDCLYFVEVKYRARADQGSGLEYVTATKQRQMRFAAEIWQKDHDWAGDCVLSAIELSGPEFRVDTFIESIF